MKVIDFEKKGNLVRFFLGADNCEDYYGDDWNDSPYEYNAGPVYNEFIEDHIDVVFPFDMVVCEPCQDYHNNGNSKWCKDDMKDRKVPCIVAARPASDDTGSLTDNFGAVLAMDNAVKIYFGDNVYTFMDMQDAIIVHMPSRLRDYAIRRTIELMRQSMADDETEVTELGD